MLHAKRFEIRPIAHESNVVGSDAIPFGAHPRIGGFPIIRKDAFGVSSKLLVTEDDARLPILNVRRLRPIYR